LLHKVYQRLNITCAAASEQTLFTNYQFQDSVHNSGNHHNNNDFVRLREENSNEDGCNDKTTSCEESGLADHRIGTGNEDCSDWETNPQPSSEQHAQEQRRAIRPDSSTVANSLLSVTLQNSSLQISTKAHHQMKRSTRNRHESSSNGNEAILCSRCKASGTPLYVAGYPQQQSLETMEILFNSDDYIKYCNTCLQFIRDSAQEKSAGQRESSAMEMHHKNNTSAENDESVLKACVDTFEEPVYYKNEYVVEAIVDKRVRKVSAHMLSNGWCDLKCELWLS
jgi:hypothetical protein